MPVYASILRNGIAIVALIIKPAIIDIMVGQRKMLQMTNHHFLAIEKEAAIGSGFKVRY